MRAERYNATIVLCVGLFGEYVGLVDSMLSVGVTGLEYGLNDHSYKS